MKTMNTKTPNAIGRNLDQEGDANLASNGQDNNSRITTKSSKYSGNQHGGRAGGNYGRGPTVGNNGTPAAGPEKPPTSSLPNFKAAMGANDSLNFGKQERTPGGTRPFDPKPGQNYRGNPDQINMGRGPVRGNSQ